METFGAGAEKTKSLRKKNGGRRASVVFVVETFFCVLWAVQHRCSASVFQNGVHTRTPSHQYAYVDICLRTDVEQGKRPV